LYPEGPGTCHVVILHPPGGIAASDRLAIRASFGRGSTALLTTPGATKWYRSEGEWARQDIRFSLQEDAVLEWLPRESIYYDGARVRAGLDVSLADGAKFFGWDIVSFGRRASGESWGRGGFDVRTSVRCGARRLWAELANVEADGGFAQSPVGLAGAAVYGSFLAAGVAVDAATLAACRALPAGAADCRTGITVLPEMWIARYLGNSTEEAFDWFSALWSLLRPALTQRPACAPRVWAC
jgi:urease accessory protein